MSNRSTNRLPLSPLRERGPGGEGLLLLLLLFLATAANAASPEPVRARQGMVASSRRAASEAGVAILRRGGNAVDAAVAVAFALSVTNPANCGLGGGGFLLIRQSDGRATVIDYRETAPAAATRTMYLDAKGDLIRGEGSSRQGYRASGVPGTVAGLAWAHRRYGSGRIAWAQLVEPARRLAADGFPVSRAFAESLWRERNKLGAYTDSRRIFLNGGKRYAEGAMLRQPELARTLGRIISRGPREFYTGETARLLAADMARRGGTITAADLAGYRVRERAPLRGSYRGYPILTMPPPSSGGVALLHMLNILEGYEMARMGPFSSERYHLLAETMRRAFADRAEYGGDPDFVSVPVAELTSKAYAVRRRATISPERAGSSKEIKPGLEAPGERRLREGEHTTHFTVVDKDGSAVTNTFTLNETFGSGVTARGTGVLLNNEMDDFTSKPGSPNLFGLIQGERNAIAPGKRPLSSMTPTFVLRRDGSLWFALGSPGGPTIINTVLQILTNVVDHGMTVQQAVDAPRIHHQWLPDEIVYEPFGLSEDTRRALAARGHKLIVRPAGRQWLGDAQAVLIETRTGMRPGAMRLGASDPRGGGAAVGY